ncbi:MAG: RNA methyltransferase [Hyphomonadaceae bacterium]|nr:RNA methyltransferase [Hyphomonadaceae bacterium]
MPETITSAANAAVKTLRSLATKKGRKEAGLLLAEGERLMREAAELGRWPQLAAVSEAALGRPSVRDFVRAAENAGTRVLILSPRLLEQITRRDNAQSVIGAYRPRLAELTELTGDLLVALHEVRDPGNLGTILRTCDAVGASGVVLTGECCDPFSVEAVRASMGSIFAIPLVQTQFQALDAWRKRAGCSVIGTSLRAAQRHDEPDVSGRVILLMGNEQSGLPPDIEAACDHLVRIPMRGRADSLNLAVSTSVMLYDVWRRRGFAKPNHA